MRYIDEFRSEDTEGILEFWLEQRTRFLRTTGDRFCRMARPENAPRAVRGKRATFSADRKSLWFTADFTPCCNIHPIWK